MANLFIIFVKVYHTKSTFYTRNREFLLPQQPKLRFLQENQQQAPLIEGIDWKSSWKKCNRTNIPPATKIIAMVPNTPKTLLITSLTNSFPTSLKTGLPSLHELLLVENLSRPFAPHTLLNHKHRWWLIWQLSWPGICVWSGFRSIHLWPQCYNYNFYR
jgi:hypothetical protein